MYDHKSLLDRRREGQEFSLADINTALRNSGDLAADGGKRLDFPIPQESETTRTTGSEDLVGSCESGHQQTSWTGWSKYLDYRDAEATQ